MQIPQQIYDDYIKKPVGEFDPETAAYLYQKQEGNQLQLKHPLVRLISAQPWILLLPALCLSLFGLFTRDRPQVIQAPAGNNAPYIININ